MGETARQEKAHKTSFFKGLKTEFKKVIWPDQTTVTKQTIAVLIASVILSSIIAIIDLLIKYGLGLVLK